MSETRAVQNVLNFYSISASRGDIAALVSTYTPDGVWEVPALQIVCRGRDEIQATSESIVAPMAYMVQSNSPALIQVDGSSATAQSVIRECGKFTDRDELLEVLGIYEDTLVKTDSGWQFARRVFHLSGMHKTPTLPTF